MTKADMQHLTRRDLLGAGAALAAANAFPSSALAQSAKYRRWEITDPAMPPRVLASYKKGIAKMLGLPATDPRNWYRNAFLHVFDCPHANWWFLPWHRAYLGWLEVALRDLSEDNQFALPYWDWTKTQRVPAAMFDDVLDPNSAAFTATFDKFKTQFAAPFAALWTSFSQPQKDVLSLRGINSPADFWDAVKPGVNGMFFNQPNARGLTAASPDLDATTKVAVSMRTIISALKAATFAEKDSNKPAGFASDELANHNDSTRKGILEGQPHDNVHGAMGGRRSAAFMVNFLSPVDPIFFLHHGNLDRLWDVWTRRQTALRRPTLPEGADLTTWSDEQFLFFSNEKGQPVSKTKAGDYKAMTVFDYDYTPGSGEDQVPASGPAVAAAAVPVRVFNAQIASASIGAGELAGGVAQVTSGALQTAAPETPVPIAEVTLNLTPADQGRRFRVLVSSSPGGSPVEAGGITIFSHHVHGPTIFTVPLPEALSATAGAGGNIPLDIRVVPIEPDGAAPLGGAPPGPSPQVSAIRVMTN
jgi:tyrosinase